MLSSRREGDSVNLTFSIFDREIFLCNSLVYKNSVVVNGVNVFITFFLLYILMLSKDCFSKMLLEKISFLFVFNSINTGGIYYTKTRW